MTLISSAYTVSLTIWHHAILDYHTPGVVAADGNLADWVNRPGFPNPNASNMEDVFDEKISPLIHDHIIEKNY
jgi:hypothetical protein